MSAKELRHRLERLAAPGVREKLIAIYYEDEEGVFRTRGGPHGVPEGMTAEDFEAWAKRTHPEREPYEIQVAYVDRAPED